MIAILFVTLLGQSSCSKYGRIGQPASEYAEAVYAICNRKDATRIAEVEQRLREARDRGELTPHEEKYLLEILTLARNEQWEQANANARRLLLEQQR